MTEGKIIQITESLQDKSLEELSLSQDLRVIEVETHPAGVPEIYWGGLPAATTAQAGMKVITISSSLTPAKKRECLAHGLGHHFLKHQANYLSFFAWWRPVCVANATGR